MTLAPSCPCLPPHCLTLKCDCGSRKTRAPALTVVGRAAQPSRLRGSRRAVYVASSLPPRLLMVQTFESCVMVAGTPETITQQGCVWHLYLLNTKPNSALAILFCPYDVLILLGSHGACLPEAFLFQSLTSIKPLVSRAVDQAAAHNVLGRGSGSLRTKQRKIWP